MIEFLKEMVRKVQTLTDKHRKQFNKKIGHNHSIIVGAAEQNPPITKELIILTEVLPAYLTFLQKLVSLFSIYLRIKSAPGGSSLSQEEVWPVINLLKYVGHLSIKLPGLLKYFRKSYGGIVEATC